MGLPEAGGILMAERKIVHLKVGYLKGLLEEGLEELATSLKEGWMFDPYLCSKGYPITIGDSLGYWVLVKGSVEEILELDPFVELPVLEEEEIEPEKKDPYGIRTEYIYYDKEGNPSREPSEGYVIMHKDHVYAKGTVYTLPPGVRVPTETKAVQCPQGSSYPLEDQIVCEGCDLLVRNDRIECVFSGWPEDVLAKCGTTKEIPKEADAE